MAWVRLDDGFFLHRKVVGLSSDALALYVCALCYANTTRSGGIVAAGALRMLCRGRRPRAAAQELVAAGLWEVVEGGWLIHDYEHYQLGAPPPPHAPVGDAHVGAPQVSDDRAEEIRRKRAEAGAKGAASRWGKHGPTDGNGMARATAADGKPMARANGNGSDLAYENSLSGRSPDPEPDPDPERSPPTPPEVEWQSAIGLPSPDVASEAEHRADGSAAPGATSTSPRPSTPGLTLTSPAPAGARQKGTRRHRPDPNEPKAHQRYAEAFALGQQDVSGEVFVPPTDSKDQHVFRNVLPVRARRGGPNGPKLEGDELLAWIRQSSAEFRRARPSQAHYGGFTPAAWAKWLNAGRPTDAEERRGRSAPLLQPGNGARIAEASAPVTTEEFSYEQLTRDVLDSEMCRAPEPRKGGRDAVPHG